MNCSCYSWLSVQLSYHHHGKCVNKSHFLRILQYQLLSEPINEFVTRRLFLPQQYKSRPWCFGPTNRPIIRVELTLYLPHKLSTDLMLRCYLQETQPSPIKLLIMKVRIRNSELHLHPIVLTLTVICYKNRELWYLLTVLTYQSHVTSLWHLSN
jgi:hypothetical protein